MENLCKDGKTRSQCPLSRHSSGSSVTSDRQRLEEMLTNLKKSIQEKDQQLVEKNKCSEADQLSIKEIRNQKEATISDRKKIDDDISALNSEMTTKRDLLMKLQGSLQYRKEEALNEAIKRLQVQLETNNYKVLEEKKIVQEIDRLKRSKKNLKEYLSLREDLDRIKDRQRMKRDQRDTLYRHVTSLKVKEDKLMKENVLRRSTVDQLKQELDEMYALKRNIIADVKQLPAIPTTHLKTQNVPQRRPSSFKRKDSSQPPREECPFRSLQDTTTHWKKDKIDPSVEKRRTCNTLITYLQRLLGSSPLTPTAPVPEHSSFPESTQKEIQDGEKLLVLLKKPDDDEVGIKMNRGSKKGRKDRKKIQQNKLLSHTPEMLEQFFNLGLSPPSMLSDVPASLEALSAKAHSLLGEDVQEVIVAATCEPGYNDSTTVQTVLGNDSIKIAAMIAKVENDILGLKCDNGVDSEAAMNGELANDLHGSMMVNGTVVSDSEDDKIENDDGQSTQQVAKVHFIKIPLGGQNLNGISATDILNKIEGQLMPTDDCLPSLINPNEDLYANGERNSTQTCNGDLTISLHSSRNTTMIPEL